jgi:hypothetical protein
MERLYSFKINAEAAGEKWLHDPTVYVQPLWAESRDAAVAMARNRLAESLGRDVAENIAIHAIDIT